MTKCMCAGNTEAGPGYVTCSETDPAAALPNNKKIEVIGFLHLLEFENTIKYLHQFSPQRNPPSPPHPPPHIGKNVLPSLSQMLEEKVSNH